MAVSPGVANHECRCGNSWVRLSPALPSALASSCVAHLVFLVRNTACNFRHKYNVLGLRVRAYASGLGFFAVTFSLALSSAVLGNFTTAVGSAVIIVSFLCPRPSHGDPAMIALPTLSRALLMVLSVTNALCNRCTYLSPATTWAKFLTRSVLFTGRDRCAFKMLLNTEMHCGNPRALLSFVPQVSCALCVILLKMSTEPRGEPDLSLSTWCCFVGVAVVSCSRILTKG